MNRSRSIGLLGSTALACIFFGGFPAWGGTELGNSGNVVACLDGRIEVLDLYEARALYGLQLDKNLPSDALPIDLAQTELGKLRSVDPVYFQLVRAELDRIQSEIRFLPPSNCLTPLPDGFPIVLPRSCEIRLLANYSDTLETVWIDQDLWARLGSVQQAALLLHESVYRTERVRYSAENSILSRKIVAHLFSNAALDADLWRQIHPDSSAE